VVYLTIGTIHVIIGESKMGKKSNHQSPYTRDSNLLEYGITEEQYQVLLESQNFGCKICGATTTNKLRKNLSVDHDHRTGRIRGLLCGKCNPMLGLADDNPVILLKAIQYLKGNL
jgi:hypothetical protein